MVRVDIVRILCLVALFIAILIDPTLLQWAGRTEVQLILATAVVAVLLTYDVIVGFILGIILIVVYFRYHMDKFGIVWGSNKMPASSKALVGKYITPEHLESAQDNVVDKNNVSMEIKGITGVYGEAVYGAQGADSTMPGYTTPQGLTGRGQEL